MSFTREQVDGDELPRVCMVCGEASTEAVNRTFTYKPEWVEYLYFAGFFPGLIAERFCSQEMRVSCPVCPEHRKHWSKLVWVASAGWLLGVPSAGLALALGVLLRPVIDLHPAVSAGSGAAVGLALWLVVVIRMAITRVRVSKISSSGDEITFERVSEAFVRAAGAGGAGEESMW